MPTKYRNAPRTPLKRARERIGLTQEALAKRLGVKRLTIIDIEKGRRQPSFATMRDWANELGVSMDMFVIIDPRDLDDDQAAAE